MTIFNLIDTLDTFVTQAKTIIADPELSESRQIHDISTLAKKYGLWNDVTVNS